MPMLMLSLVWLGMLLPAVVHAVSVEAVRVWTAPDHTRVVLDVSAKPAHRIFSLANPDRLVIDLDDAALAVPGQDLRFENRHIQRLRHGRRNGTDLRLVLDLTGPVRPKSFALPPAADKGHRLVVDLYDRKPVEPPAAAAAVTPATAAATDEAPTAAEEARDLVIAIDPGHGGEDPGATGPRGTREKVVTLQIARRLQALIDAEPGMRAVLTRSGDYQVRLRRRIAIAREHRADMFVSIHADAFRDARVRGASVYVLSERGASSEAARWLAERENAADLVGGVSLVDKDDLLASVLLDLSQTGTRQASLWAAERIYRSLGEVGKVHGRRVQKAGFVVLKSPDIPSMLVETGFISNPTEERNLRDGTHQDRLARAIFNGIEDYFVRYPVPGTLLAQQQAREPIRYVIRRGDTLSEIAERHRISLAELRRRNGLRDDVIQVGQVLQIPGS